MTDMTNDPSRGEQEAASLGEPGDTHDDTESAATPLKAIRRHCLNCCDGSSNEVAGCVSKRCPLWLLRFGRKPTADEVAAVADIKTQPIEHPLTQAELAAGSRLKAIRRRCWDCSGANLAEVRGCKHTTCDLHPFRMGKGNRRQTPEQAAKAAERFQAWRERQQSEEHSFPHGNALLTDGFSEANTPGLPNTLEHSPRSEAGSCKGKNARNAERRDRE